MTAQADTLHISIEEYMQGELASDIRHEYVGGGVYAMVGASDRHNLISGNLFSAIRSQLRGTGCQAFINDMKVHIKAAANTACFYYPDIMLCCSDKETNAYYREHPCLIVEILSDSTERLDRREKFFAYVHIKSLREYILVDQNKQTIEHFKRHNDWQPQVTHSGDLILECVDARVAFDTIYEDISFEA